MSQTSWVTAHEVVRVWKGEVGTTAYIGGRASDLFGSSGRRTGGVMFAVRQELIGPLVDLGSWICALPDDAVISIFESAHGKGYSASPSRVEAGFSTLARALFLDAPFSRGKKAIYGLLAPLFVGVVGVVGFWPIGVATYGEGPSVAGRGMVLFLVLFPAGFVTAAVLNTWVLFVSLRHRISAFLLGTIVPAIGLVLADAYQWRIWPFQR